MKYFVCMLAVFGFILTSNTGLASNLKPAPKTQSRAVLIYDVKAGKMIYKKNINTVYPIASLTKLMMAVVALDARLPKKQKIKVSTKDRDLLKNTHSRLTVGSTSNRDNMLHIALMSSENRAAAALSRYYPHGRKAFIKRMNSKAMLYHMMSTHYKDSTGLSPQSVSTAHDLLLLVKHASQYPVIRQYSTDKEMTIETGKGRLIYRNSNGLINNKTWNIHLQKTGFTNEAGHSMVLNTSINNRPYIFIILGSRSHYGHYADVIMLKNWLLKRN